jgi:phage major head subunit gpT-like protein
MAITRGKLARALGPAAATVFFNRVKRRDPEYQKWIKVLRSKRAWEEYIHFAGLGPFVPKVEGRVYTFDEPIEGTPARFIHNTYGLAYRVTLEMVEDDDYGIINRLADELGKAAWYNKEVQAASVLNNGFNAAFVGHDGQPLFSTAHPTLGGGTASNRPAVHADIGVATLQAAIEAFENMTDDRGMPVMMVPKHIVTGPAQIWTVQEILQSDYNPYATDAGNAQNIIKSNYGLQLTVSHFLSDPDAWYLLSDKDDHELVMYIRVDDEFNSDDDVLTGDLINTGRHRLSTGFRDWRGAYASAGA